MARRFGRRIPGLALALSLAHALPALGQGVIAPPPEGEAVAPQPPVAPGAATSEAPRPSAQPRMQGPASVADLAEGLLPSVVNISTTRGSDASGRGMPELSAPEGSPLREFFDEMDRDGGGEGGPRDRSLGSGFVLDAQGLVVTNNHVIAGADEITVNFADGSSLVASVVGVDPKTDLAVLRVEPETPLTPVVFGDSDAVRVGDWVMAIGNPFGLGGSVSVGIVSARNRRITDGPYDDFIQTDAAINRGNSGGPLFDMYGQLIGINTAIISPTGGSIGIGFSIPALLAESVVTQLTEHGETRRGWIGLRHQVVSDSLATSLGLPAARGALVLGIVPDGPSQGSGIEIGDVITRFDGRDVATARDLPRIVAETEIGRTVTLEVWRKPTAEAPLETIEIEIVLGRLDEGGAAPTSATEQEGDESAPDGGRDSANALTLGLALAPLDDAAREEFAIADEVEGVLIAQVPDASPAAEEGLLAGQTIVEVGQERVADLDALRSRLDELRATGQRNAGLLVAEPDGTLRFVVVPLN